MPQYVDLHMHTAHSDGVHRVQHILDIVRDKRLAAFALTDHDTLAGFDEASELIGANDPELIPGVELSVDIDGHDVHILAYFFDPYHERLREILASFRERRNRRGRSIVENLNQLGVEITYEEVLELAGDAAVSRPHIAEALHRRKAVPTYESAFEKLIGTRGPAYVAKAAFTPSEAISLIRDAGGVSVLAHPVIDDARDHLELLVDLGLDGIEVYHSAHKQRDTDQLKHLAQRYRLAISGGSDFHGREGRYGRIGSQRVPVACLESLREKAKHKRGYE